MKTKGINLVKVREIIRKQAPDVEKMLLAELSPDAEFWYQTAVATSWIPMSEDGQIKIAAARLLFPDLENSASHLQRLIAHENMSGLYSVFMRIPRLQSVIKFSAKMWRTFWQKGRAKVMNETEHHLSLVVTDFPELDLLQAPLIAGFLMGILDLGDLKNITYDFDDSNPEAWQWHLSWDN